MLSSLTGAIETVLVTVHDVLEPLAGPAAWGWAIIAVTIAVRLLLLPIAVRQYRSMRAMRELQPQLKALREQHRVDRDLLRRDPETYRRRKQALTEATQELYREAGVNPAAGCLPLVVQAPVFISLLRVLRTSASLKNAPFYAFTAFASVTAQFHGLGTTVREAGPGGWALVAMMVVTMAVSTRQSTRLRTVPSASGSSGAQQRVMGVAMPAVFGVMSLGFPIGVLLYWVTSNAWQVAQQHVLERAAAGA